MYLINQPEYFHEISAYGRYLDVMSIVLFKMQVNDKCKIIMESYGICRVLDSQLKSDYAQENASRLTGN